MPLPKQSQNRPLDIIIGKGLLSTEAMLSSLRNRIAAKAAKYRAVGNSPFLIAMLQEEIERIEPLLAENIFSTDVAAWVQSIREVEGKIPARDLKKFLPSTSFYGPPLPPIPPGMPRLLTDPSRPPVVRFPVIEKAVDSLLQKRIVTRQEFDAMAAEERQRAFTIAREGSLDAIDRVRMLLAENIEDGASLANFEKAVKGELESSFIGPWHQEVIFRTNAQNAFSQGHWEISQNPIVAEIFPYREYLAIHDRRARKNHLALEKLGLSGTNVYLAEDWDFWNDFLPSWEYNCRCGTNLLTIEQAAERGVKHAQQWLRTGKRPPSESRRPYIPFDPPPGFSRGRRVAA